MRICMYLHTPYWKLTPSHSIPLPPVHCLAKKSEMDVQKYRARIITHYNYDRINNKKAVWTRSSGEFWSVHELRTTKPGQLATTDTSPGNHRKFDKNNLKFIRTWEMNNLYRSLVLAFLGPANNEWWPMIETSLFRLSSSPEDHSLIL